MKIKAQEKITIESILKTIVGLLVEASESVKDCGQFHVFGTFLKYCLMAYQAILQPFDQKSEAIL